MTRFDRVHRARARASQVARALKGEQAGGPAAERAGDPRFHITLDYPVDPVPRFGYGHPEHRQLGAIIRAGDDSYARRLRSFAELQDRFAQIPVTEESSLEPHWHNGWFQGLDAVALYGFVTQERPERIVEVGSGNSTKFARRAISDSGLPTTITSIDPQPRAEIDRLCDQVIRQPLEDVDLAIFDTLDAGDICFLDGSHRSFMNSDATVFFTEVLPRLRGGVIVHVHDIFLPWDYPPQIGDWFYSEQYLLACWLLGGDHIEILLPNFYISTQPAIHHLLDVVWDRFTWSATATNGTGIWFRVTAGGH